MNEKSGNKYRLALQLNWKRERKSDKSSCGRERIGSENFSANKTKMEKISGVNGVNVKLSCSEKKLHSTGK